MSHHRQRIILEVFHALSDGTGALWFLTDLVTAYVRLRYPDRSTPADEDHESTGQPTDSGRTDSGRTDAGDAPTHELIPDSFAHYFRGGRRRRAAAAESEFGRAAVPAVLAVAADKQTSPHPPTGVDRPSRPTRRKVHQVSGTRTPDNRTRVVELTMPVRDVLALARAEGVALTMYLTAVFFEAVRSSSDNLGMTRTLAASVPVNLRQFFSSTSPRNFFATIRVEHTYGEGPDDLGSICRNLDRQFRPEATPEALEKKLRKLIWLEQLPALRVVPRPVKDVILKLVNWDSNRGLTIAVSNLGRVSLPGPAESRVGRMQFHVSAARPQLSAVSHAGLLTLSFTSPFSETDHIREFARLLTGRGVPVTVAAVRVTEAELAESAS
ncbi:MAG: alcohol acetyltransferase [Microlunatus sp.]